MWSIKRPLFWLWPPFELWLEEKEIKKGLSGMNDTMRWESILKDVRASLKYVKESNDLGEIDILAKQIQDSEAKRKDTLEDKASSYVSSFTIALSIISLAAALFTDNQMPIICAISLASIYIIAIIHLFAATFYAVKARRVTGFAGFSADKFIEDIKANQWKTKDRIVFAISETKWNENILLRKSNSLDVSERLFVHGLFLVLFAIIMGVTIEMLKASKCFPLF